MAWLFSGGVTFSILEIHFLFFKNEFREGTYPLCCMGDLRP